jgi:hypothetical protein
VTDIAERAERLRVVLAVFGQEGALDPRDALRQGLPLLNDRDIDLLDGATPIDFEIANALIAAGREFRAAEYRAAESLLATIPGGSAPLREQINRLPLAQMGDAAIACLQLHWIDNPTPNGDD